MTTPGLAEKPSSPKRSFKTQSFGTSGESVKRVSPTLKAAVTEVPWKSIAGLRNVLVHDYLGVDLERVWSVVESDLGDLRESLEAALASPPGGSG